MNSLYKILPLCLLSTLRPLHSQQVGHAELYNRANKVTRSLIDQDGLPVTVTWTCPPVLVVSGKPVPPKYQLEITRDPAADDTKPYSLYNLGLQGRYWEVTIEEITGKDVQVIDKNSADIIGKTT